VQRIEELDGPVAKREERDTRRGIDYPRGAPRIEDEIGSVEHVVHGSADRRVALGQLGERVAFQREPEVQTVRTLQVVEAIAVLQLLQLMLEDEIEGRPEQTAEHGGFLSHTARPEVDVVDTAGGGRSEEVTNSSSSFPIWRTVPRMMEPAASAAVSGPAGPPSLYKAGLRNAVSRRTSLTDPSTLVRPTLSGSIEWPRR